MKGCLDSWVVSYLTLNIGMPSHALVSLSLGDNKLFFGTKYNIYAFFLILFVLFDLILLIVCQICHVIY